MIDKLTDGLLFSSNCDCVKQQVTISYYELNLLRDGIVWTRQGLGLGSLFKIESTKNNNNLTGLILVKRNYCLILISIDFAKRFRYVGKA